MNQELAKQLSSLVEAAKQAGSDAATFIIEQAPDVANQFIRWKIVSGVADILLGSAALFLAYKLYGKVNAYLKDNSHEDVFLAWMPCGLVLAALSVPGVFFLYDGLSSTLKCLFAPKIVLLEALSTLVR